MSSSQAEERLEETPRSPEVEARLDAVCDLFEEDWKASSSLKRPTVEEYLAWLPEPEQVLVLPELILLDIYYRRKEGENPQITEYQARFPALDLLHVEQTLNDLDASPLPSTHQTLRFAREEPAFAPGISSDGSTFADYEIQTVLGQGGMGIVYLARQRSLKRAVALKTLLAPFKTDRRALERFQSEAEILARLKHPNIVPIYEVRFGQEDPFFTMELVEGGSLADKTNKAPQPVPWAAEMVQLLVLAMHAAHEKGIIHRDLKPSNVLLTREGVPRISDFGLAKLLDSETPRTRTGELMGTPSYMAPEQARGDVKQTGPEADVYSLGAILYELLTGRPPFIGESTWATLQQVMEQEPVSPRELQPQLSVDLETICLKCLEKDPARRYESADALALDLGRFLRQEPIHARPVGLPGRLARWRRRHVALANTFLVLALVLISGLVSVTVLWRLAESRRRTAEVATGHAEDAKKRARDSIKEAFVLATAHPTFRGDGMQPARKLLLETALRYFRDLSERHHDDADLRLDVADAHYRVGVILSLLGHQEEALAELQQAKLLVEQSSDPKAQSGLAMICNELSDLHFSLGKPVDQARVLLEKSIQILESISPESRSHDVLLLMADAHFKAGELQSIIGERKQALQSFDHSERYCLQARERAPQDTYGMYRQGAIKSARGKLLLELKQRKKAKDALIEGRKLFRALLEKHPRHLDFRRGSARLSLTLGVFYLSSKETRPAQEAFHQAKTVFEDLVSSNPEVPQYRLGLANALVNEGTLLARQGDSEKARPLYQEAEKHLSQVLRTSPRDVQLQNNLASTLHEMGMIHSLYGEEKKALTLYQRAAHIREGLVAMNPTIIQFQQFLSRDYNNQAASLLNLGREKEALLQFQRLENLREKLVRQDPQNQGLQRDLGAIYINIAVQLMNQHSNQKALSYYTKAKDIFRALIASGSNPEHRFLLAVAHLNAGSVYRELKKAEISVREFEEAAQILEGLRRSQPTLVTYQLLSVRSALAIGIGYLDLNKRSNARTALEQGKKLALAIVRKHPRLHAVWSDLGQICVDLGIIASEEGESRQALQHRKEAVEHQRRAYELAGKSAQYRDRLIQALDALSRSQRKLKLLSELQSTLKERGKLSQQNKENRGPR